MTTIIIISSTLLPSGKKKRGMFAGEAELYFVPPQIEYLSAENIVSQL